MNYTTGTVRIRSGSAAVRGETGNENFLTYVGAGYLFKVAAESAWYQVAAITNATNFTLTSRYSNTSYQTSRAENLATMTTATKMYSGILDYTPAIQNSVVLNASIERFVDNGAGVLTGNASPAGSGTVSYDDGAWTITLGTDLTATAIVNASYLSGDLRSGISYQIVRDYTPYHNLPEMSPNDTNFAYIYTKAMRIVDQRLYAASHNSIKANTATITTASINNLNVFDLDVVRIKATNATITTASINNLSANIITASDNIKTINYYRIGTNKYIFGGTSTTSPTIVAEATALVATPIKGSLYLGAGDTWKFNSDTTATKI